MKTSLEKYISQTHRLLLLSLLVTGLGVYLHFAWSSLGGILALIGFVGLVWSFLRR